MWTMETTGPDCDCPGPPPEFLLPPPPRPPILQSTEFCSEDPLPIETCDALPLIDASYRSSPNLQTSAVIVFCSVLLGLFLFIVIILVWKHKRKVQNFLPCKNSGPPPQNNCDVNINTYEDIIPIPRPTPTHLHHAQAFTGRHIVAPSIEMIDVKNNIHYPSGYPISQHPPVFLCSSPGPDPYSSQDLYNPVYEELSDADSEITTPAILSEDEFAEDELSLGGEIMERRRLHGSISNPHQASTYRQQPCLRRYRKPHEPLPPPPTTNKRHRSLDRQFHEGMLLDALLQLYPRVGSIETQSHNTPSSRGNHIPSITQRIPCLSPPMPGSYDIVSSAPYGGVIGHLATFRPKQQDYSVKPYSQDSALGSDSGYSNHTSTRSSSNRGRTSNSSSNNKEPARRLSQLSVELPLT